MGLQHWKRRELTDGEKQRIDATPERHEAIVKRAIARPEVREALKKPGPKPSGNAKQLISLRLDQDVIEKFRATGPGWQARMNDVLKAAKP